MGIKVVKKIGMGFAYYIIATLFSTLLDMFGIFITRGIFFAIVHVLVLGGIICASSRYLRIAKLKKEHKGDESQEKVIFNSDLKTKIKFIIATQDFKIEAVLFVLISAWLLSPLVLGATEAIGLALAVLLLILAVILLSLYMAVIDIAAWIMAYDRCYKRREF